MQTLTERRSYPGHPVLTKELFVEVGGTAMLEEDQCRVAAITHQPVHHPEAQSRSHERKEPHDKALWEAREAHQQALEATLMLELDIKRLSQEAENVLHQHPCSLSGSHLQSGSLDRHEKTLSWHRAERHVTFCDPEVEPILGEDPYGEHWGHLTKAQMERGKEVPLPIWRLEMLCPWEMPATHVGNENRMGILPEPWIKDYEVWLTWWAHFLDTPHWWGELTSIQDVEDLKRLAQKICASFLILAVRCETLQNQDYTMPPAPKCLSRSRFLPDNPSYQYICQQPLLLTLAYAQALQYWAEKVSPPTPSGYCPLAMSIVELRWWVEGHLIFSK